MQARLDAARRPRPIARGTTATATVAAYSVVHGRDGEPEWGLRRVRPARRRRARTRRIDDADLLAAAETEELVGAELR